MPEPPHEAVVHLPERRQSKRYRCNLEIAMEWGSVLLPGHVSEISGTGMFIELNDPLWIGASFAAQLALEESVKLECVVRRVVPRRGMAVSFEPAGEAERAAVAALLTEIGH
jgi:hypothetical protein